MRRVTIENIFLFLCSMSVLLNVMPGQVFAQDVPAPQPDPVNINEEIDAPAYAVAPQETILPMPRTVTPSTENPSTPPLLEEVDLKEVEVTDVLKMISQKSGLNIVIGSTVTGKVSLYLKGVTAKDVLDIVAKTNDLAYVEDGRLIHVMTGADYERIYGRKFFKKTKTVLQKLNYISVAEVVPMLERMKSPSGVVLSDPRSSTISLNDLPENILDMIAFIREIDVPRMTQVFDLTYAKAEDLSERINLILTPTVGSMRFDKRTNKISVTDIPDKIHEIERMINAFDVKEQQVAIEAKIVQVILSDNFQMGVDWEAVVESSHNLTMVGNFDVLNATDKAGRMSIGTLADDHYTAMIEALQTYGKTENLSNPHIMVINNQEAKILVGSTEPYVTSTTTTPASGPTTTAETVNFIEVGVKLYVTPTIHKDGFVTLKIKPEVSSVTRNVTTSNNNTIPVVETSEAETTVLVKDGVTIVIGGLIKDEKINTDTRIPLLGSIPLVGGAFRSKDYLTRKTELVIFLTPRISTGAMIDARKVGNVDVRKVADKVAIKKEKSEPQHLQ
ncbi:MAG: hypothetical protein IT395_05140 [Candidatus Omnitrophica bacterium]|nr:hypothetical protein [Candidatus Omnitrophota bacterium]